MIATCITDRLGNQLFQYAIARGLAARNNTTVAIDKRYYDRNPPEGYFYGLDAFNIPQRIITKKEIKEYTGLSDSLIHKVIRKIVKGHQKSNPNYMYHEKFFHYDEEVNKLGDKVYLRGYWQSYKYFENVDREIREEFTFKYPVDRNEDVFARQILASNAVCLSIRRGDHLWHPETSKKYGTYSPEYYTKGLEIIKEKEKELTLFVFSDDIDWCSANLEFNHPTVFVKHQFDKPRFDYYLQLIAMCKHFIIPVSTFPWWGAWLSTNQNKIVIAPKVWFKDPVINTDDLFPQGWTRI